MGIEENKAVVRQYLTGIHAAPPDLTVLDELLAPSYQGDRARQKALAAAVHAAVAEQSFEIVELVAEGDTVVARFKYRATFPDGSMVKARGYGHFRLADGKIVAQHVMTNPDMMPVLAPLLPPPTRC
jgi:ketosteroid isomerase-like protein